jgi:LuxR family maltose regulon positive regulatory protein
LDVDARGSTLARPAVDTSLLDAKFAVPPPRPGTVARGDLIKAAQSSQCRLVAVTAPAGYGKSTFLAEWARSERRPVAWASLDRFDDDPAMLLVSLAIAFRRAGLGSAELADGIGCPGFAVLLRAAPRVAAVLRASPVPFVLMLDDLHELTSPACHDVLGIVISGIPPGSVLAAASRDEQPHVPRLRAHGDALEFCAGDLALDADGARRIFAGEQVSLTRALAATVTKQTEGWPAGLHLAALMAKESRDPTRTITGEDRYVADYLYREVFLRQPPDMQRFLRRTAVLYRLSGPLCDAVLGGLPGAAGRLRRMEASGLFVVCLDRRRRWYRYHALFRQFLLGELRSAEPDAVAGLHQRAAGWYESAGSPALALEHLIQAADWDHCARLAAELAQPMYMNGQLATVQRWFRAIGDANIERYPQLAMLRCWEAILTGDTARAERWAAFVATASCDLAYPDAPVSFESAQAMLRAAWCADGPEQMTADAAFGVAGEPAWSPWRAAALWLLGEARLLAGHAEEAAGLLAEASDAAAANGSADIIVKSESLLASLAVERGDWQEAADRLGRALTAIDEKGMPEYITCLLAFAVAARVSVHHGDLSQAHRRLTQAMQARHAATYVMPFVAVRLRLQLARVYLGMADTATARQLLREIDDILVHRPELGTLGEEVEKFRCALASSSADVTARPALTAAELRLLPYLPTHLTASGIAERLCVSSHTVKAEIKSIYRKLGVSSRNEAVQKAMSVGLLGA